MGDVAPQERLATLPEGLPKLTLGYEALAWAAKYLRHPNGIRAGKAWQFTREQARFVLWFYALDENGRWLFHHGARRLAKGSGKSPFAAVMALIELLAPVRFDHWNSDVPGGVVGKPVSMPWVQIAAVSLDQPLALDTPVRTVDGWKTVDTVGIGDYVFGSDGEPVEVRRKTEVFYGRDCYELEFDSGEKIVADSGHGWTIEKTNGHGDKWESVTLTTGQIAQLKSSKRVTVRIPAVSANFPVRELPLDPWRLGFWLGDGASKSGVHAIDWRHKEELEEIYRPLLNDWEDLRFDFDRGFTGRMNVKRRDGICPRGHDYVNDLNNRYSQKGNPACRKCVAWPRAGYADPKLLSMREMLREVGVLHHKHIPDVYLTASYEQRMSLLQGLIDSDGGIDRTHRAYFVNTNRHLIDGIEDLLSSLGFKWTEQKNESTKSWKVSFKPRAGEPVARFAYKVARMPKVDEPRQYSKYHRVVSVKKVESVPVRCIGIDNDDHLFQAGRRGILTHNTENTMRMVRAMASPANAPALHRDYSLDVGKTQIFVQPEGKLEVITSSAATAEGAESTFVIGDELEHWTPSNGGAELHATLMDNLSKSGSRMLETLNAWKPGINSAGESTFNDWVLQETGRSKNESRILYDARQAPHDTEMGDADSLRSALEWVYADCPWSDIDAIMTRIWSPSAQVDDSKRKYLNWPVASSDSWCDPQDWAQMARPDIEVAPGEDIVMFFDGSLSNDHTALIGCRMADGHIFTIGVWQPKAADPDDKPMVDVQAVDDRVDFAFATWNVIGFYADVREWESFTKVAWPERYRDDLELWATSRGAQQPEPIAWDMRGKDFQFTTAAELAEAEVMQHSFTHDGNPLLTEHVLNARRHEGRYGITVRKESRKSAKKIDACVCMIGARMVWRLARERGGVSKKKQRTGKAFFI